jgi:outer membrane biosynthesis protein TonB
VNRIHPLRYLAILGLLPAFAVVFWMTALLASQVPGLSILGVNVHGLGLASYAAGSALRPAPVSLRMLHDAQQDAGARSIASPTPTGKPSPTPTPVIPPLPVATPTPTALPVATPTPIPLPVATPTPTPLPVPTPTPAAAPTPTPTPTPGLQPLPLPVPIVPALLPGILK